MEIFQYETLVREFEDALLTQLRGHTGGADFLTLWVPDNDPAKSIANMSEAARLGGKEMIHLRISDQSIDKEGIDRLRNELIGIGELKESREVGAWLLAITLI